MPLPELAAAVVVVAVIVGGLVALRQRGDHRYDPDPAAAARQARARRLASDDVAELRHELQRLLDVADLQRQHAAAIAAGQDGIAEEAALAAALRTLSTHLPLCRGVYVTHALADGQIAGYLAQYRQPTVDSGAAFEIDQAVADLSQRLWTNLQHAPKDGA